MVDYIVLERELIKYHVGSIYAKMATEKKLDCDFWNVAYLS